MCNGVLTTGHLANQHTFFFFFFFFHFFFFLFFFFFFVLRPAGRQNAWCRREERSQRTCWPNRKGGKRNEEARRGIEQEDVRRRKGRERDGREWIPVVEERERVKQKRNRAGMPGPLSFSNKGAVPYRPVAVNRYHYLLVRAKTINPLDF